MKFVTDLSASPPPVSFIAPFSVLESAHILWSVGTTHFSSGSKRFAFLRAVHFDVGRIKFWTFARECDLSSALEIANQINDLVVLERLELTFGHQGHF